MKEIKIISEEKTIKSYNLDEIRENYKVLEYHDGETPNFTKLVKIAQENNIASQKIRALRYAPNKWVYITDKDVVEPFKSEPMLTPDFGKLKSLNEEKITNNEVIVLNYCDEWKSKSSYRLAGVFTSKEKLCDFLTKKTENFETSLSEPFIQHDIKTLHDNIKFISINIVELNTEL